VYTIDKRQTKTECDLAVVRLSSVGPRLPGRMLTSSILTNVAHWQAEGPRGTINVCAFLGRRSPN